MCVDKHIHISHCAINDLGLSLRERHESLKGWMFCQWPSLKHLWFKLLIFTLVHYVPAPAGTCSLSAEWLYTLQTNAPSHLLWGEKWCGHTPTSKAEQRWRRIYHLWGDTCAQFAFFFFFFFFLPCRYLRKDLEQILVYFKVLQNLLIHKSTLVPLSPSVNKSYNPWSCVTGIAAKANVN